MTSPSNTAETPRDPPQKRRKPLLALILLIVVTVQAWCHIGLAQQGRPYEGWDEIATFNNAHVISGPTSHQTYRYGSMDTFLQWGSIIAFNYLDPVGMKFPHISYTNSNLNSFDDPFQAFKLSNLQGRINYNYYRGVDDHHPLFMSRQAHLLFGYGVVLFIGLVLIFSLGGGALFVLPGLLLLTTSPALHLELAQSLPNAINGLVAFGVAVFAMLYCDGFRLRYLLISVGLLALGMNLKPDLLLLASLPGLALCLAVWRQGLGSAVKAASAAVAVGLVVTLVTYPGMLVDPIADTRRRVMALLLGAGGPRDGVDANARAFVAFFAETWLWRGAGLLACALAIAAAAAAVVVAARRRTAPPLVLAAGFLAALGISGLVVLKSTYSDAHYFFNGAAVMAAAAGAALLFLSRIGGRAALAAKAGAGLLAAIWLIHGVAGAAQVMDMQKSYSRHEGLDPAHSRNLASLSAIALAAKPGYSPIVLVDQHAYIDLHVFRTHGLDARFINLMNLDQVLAGLDPAQSYAVVFGPGALAHRSSHLSYWEGEFTPEQSAAFEAYQQRLRALPVMASFGRNPQPILAAGPIDPSDRMIVATYLPRSENR